MADAWLPKGEFAPMELLERIRVLLIRKRGPKRPLVLPRPLHVTASVPVESTASA